MKQLKKHSGLATCEAAKEAVWLREFMKELEVVSNMHEPIRLYYDNSGAVDPLYGGVSSNLVLLTQP